MYMYILTSYLTYVPPFFHRSGALSGILTTHSGRLSVLSLAFYLTLLSYIRPFVGHFFGPVGQTMSFLGDFIIPSFTPGFSLTRIT